MATTESTQMYAAPDVMKRIMRQTGLGPTKFAKSIGVRYQRVNDIMNGRSKTINPEIIKAMCKTYPFINQNFLYTGEGELFVEVSDEQQDVPAGLTAADFREIRLLHRDILAVQQQVAMQQQQLLDRDAYINERERSLIQRERELNEREALLEQRENEFSLKNAQSA